MNHPASLVVSASPSPEACASNTAIALCTNPGITLEQSLGTSKEERSGQPDISVGMRLVFTSAVAQKIEFGKGPSWTASRMSLWFAELQLVLLSC